MKSFRIGASKAAQTRSASILTFLMAALPEFLVRRIREGNDPALCFLVCVGSWVVVRR
jgi:hypothetical protein